MDKDTEKVEEYRRALNGVLAKFFPSMNCNDCPYKEECSEGGQSSCVDHVKIEFGLEGDDTINKEAGHKVLEELGESG